MKLNELLVLEKRSNPDHPAQTKRAGIEELLKYEGRDDIFISYTDVDKIGINPQSGYDTPIGIYAYPLADVLPRLKERMDSKRVPFAGNRPFIWVLQANPMSLQDYDSGDFDRDLGKIVDYMEENRFTSEEIATIPNDAIRSARIKSIAGKMWNVTRMVASSIAKQTKTKAPVRWNKLMSDVLGYQGIVDHGDGIIHRHEKNQVVFFNKKAFQTVEKIHNISPRVSDKSSDEYIIGQIKNGQFDRAWLKNPSEAVQIAIVEKDGPAIQYIKNPSEKVQLAAVNSYGKAIEYIKNPSEEVQLAAVKQDGYVIRFIENPLEEVQLAAVKRHSMAIQFIENPSEEVQLAAVNSYGKAIEYIDNPSEKVQLAAVKQDGYVIQFIENPSKEVQFAAVNQTGYAIKFINNPSEKLQLAAVKQDGYIINYIENPSDTVKKLA